MNLGAHVSIAGGIDKAIDRGEALGCTTIQIFPGPPQRWWSPKHADEHIALFKQKHTHSPIKDVFIHAIYLCNCGSPDPAIYDKSYTALTYALELQVKIGAQGVIVHPGSHKGTDRKAGLQRVVAATHRLLKAVPNATLIFESSAGAGDTLGDSLDDLHYLVHECAQPHHVGICLDTCHMFASGIDIRSHASQRTVIASLTQLNLLSSLRVIHVNDSAKPFASHRDVHANIGQGKIGITALQSFVAQHEFNGIPLILETPILKTLTSDGQEHTEKEGTFIDGIRRSLTHRG